MTKGKAKILPRKHFSCRIIPLSPSLFPRDWKYIRLIFQKQKNRLNIRYYAHLYKLNFKSVTLIGAPLVLQTFTFLELSAICYD